MDRTLVELQPHLALDPVLTGIDQRLQHLPLGREPQPVIDQLRVARHQFVLQVRGAAVEGQLLKSPVRRVKDRAARSIVDPAALHPNLAVLDEVEAADAVCFPKRVELG